MRTLLGLPILAAILLAFSVVFDTDTSAQVPLCGGDTPATVVPCPTATVAATSTPLPTATTIPTIPPQIRISQSPCSPRVEAHFFYSNAPWQLITTRNGFIVDNEPYVFAPGMFYTDELAVPGSLYQVYAVTLGSALQLLPGTPYNLGTPVAFWVALNSCPATPTVTLAPIPTPSPSAPTSQQIIQSIPTVVAAAIQQQTGIRPPNTGGAGLAHQD